MSLPLEIIIALLLTLWAAAALFFDAPHPALQKLAACLYLLGVMPALFFLRHGYAGFFVAFAGFAIVAVWWFSLRPSNNGQWRPDAAETFYADIAGDEITIHNLRHCDYRALDDYTCHWETRSYDLAKLRAVDAFITWWGSPWLAHPIVSFDFGEQGHVAMSVETRKVEGQAYSAIRGFFRQYTLIYIAADERDVIRLRTNYRQDEEVYLFRTTFSPPAARDLFLQYLRRANRLHKRAEWYNALTNNCANNVAVAAGEGLRTRLDLRLLLSGKIDELMYQRGGFVTGGLTLAELKAQAHINSAARAAGDSPEFSRLIRAGRVGFSEGPLLVSNWLEPDVEERSRTS
jgi:hypothetical protein